MRKNYLSYCLGFAILCVVSVCGESSYHEDSIKKLKKSGADGLVTIINEKEMSPGYTAVDGCQIFNNKGELKRSFPGWICQFLNSGKVISAVANHLTLFDKELNVIWRKLSFPHHDIFIEGEKIVHLSTHIHEYLGKNVRFDAIYGFTMEGDTLFEWCSYENREDIFKAQKEIYPDNSMDDIRETLIWAPWEPKSNDEMSGNQELKAEYELLHSNSVSFIPPNDLQELDPAFRPGNLLVCMNPYFVAIMDTTNFNILWKYKTPGEGQIHHTRMKPNGNITIFDNRANFENCSRVVEINPIKNEIVWEYYADPKGSFDSEVAGSADFLPNGNVLISEQNDDVGGRVFEVTRDGKLIWEFFPKLIEGSEKARSVYRAERLDKKMVESFLEVY